MTRQPTAKWQESGRLQQFLTACEALAARHGKELAIEEDIFRDREVFIESEALRHIAEAQLGAFGIGADIHAIDNDIAGIRAQYAGKHPHDGGLASSIRAYEAEYLATGNRQIDRSHRLHRSEVFGEPLCTKDDVVHFGPHFPAGSNGIVAFAGIPGSSSCVGLSMSIRIR